MPRLEALGVPVDMQWGNLSTAQKQGCPLSPNLFSLYIDEVLHYTKRFSGTGACLAGKAIQILL